MYIRFTRKYHVRNERGKNHKEGDNMDIACNRVFTPLRVLEVFSFDKR